MLLYIGIEKSKIRTHNVAVVQWMTCYDNPVDGIKQEHGISVTFFHYIPFHERITLVYKNPVSKAGSSSKRFKLVLISGIRDNTKIYFFLLRPKTQVAS